MLKFGETSAAELRRRGPKPADFRPVEEVSTRINGVPHYLWRAVDQHGAVLDLLVQDRRNGAAAKWFSKRLLRGLRFKPRRSSPTARGATASRGATSCPGFGTERAAI